MTQGFAYMPAAAPEESYAGRLTAALNHGVLSAASCLSDLQSLTRGAHWHKALLGSDSIPLSLREIDHFAKAYRRLNHCRLIHTDDPVCVEDDVSAVFLRNTGDRSLLAADYRASEYGGIHLLTAGRLDLVGEDHRSMGFHPAAFYLGVVDGSLEAVTHPVLREAAMYDLVHSVITALEQLAFLHADKEAN